MSQRSTRAFTAALLLAVAACGGESPTAPTAEPAVPTALALPLPTVRISEFHYDNTGTDVNERIEVSFPTGTAISGYSIVRYNGNPATAAVPYTTPAGPGVLTGASTAITSCGARSVLVASYPANGLQNGPNDGFALVDPSGAVVELLSYAGVLTAASGPAAGRTSEDVLVTEPSTAPVGSSIQRNANDIWAYTPGTNTFGACNDDGPAAPVVPVATLTLTPTSGTLAVGGTLPIGAVAQSATGETLASPNLTWSTSSATVATVSATGVVTAVAVGTATVTATAPSGVAASAVLTVQAVDAPPPADLPSVRFSELHYDNAGTDANEALEVDAPAGTDLTGWSIVLYNGNGGAAYNTTTLSGVVSNIVDGRGTALVCYATDGLQNGSPDGMALINAAGAVVEFLSYEGSFAATNGPAAGRTSTDIGASQLNAAVGTSLQRSAANVWAPAPSSYRCPNQIGFTGRTVGDPPLPVGFEDQLFATLRTSSGVVVPTTFTWSSDTPALATIDARGVMRAVAAGEAIVRATAADGSTATITLRTVIPAASQTAIYEGNAEFGEPTDADASDDFLIRRREFTSSFSRTRNTPNWVSYNLEATHFGPEDRCDCFTYDPLLPSSFDRYTTADYTGVAAINFPIDRGHLARSADRTGGAADNAASFLFSNIIPQASDQNQGPWAVLENVLGDRARNDNREVYIITGVAGNQGTVKNEGRIVIPAFTWKVAIILPRNARLADVRRASDLELISVVMPNIAGVRNVDWNTYRVTVDSVEKLSGYNLLALLPDPIEIAVESGTSAPVAALNGPYTGLEGAVIALSAATSTDADNDALTFAWSFGDGATATGVTVSHSYLQNGLFTVRLIATDIRGLSDTVTTTATISNVAPVLATFSGATLLPGERYSTTGSFADPGQDTWSVLVDYGDGSAPRAATVTGRSFQLSNVYQRPGSFTVTARVSDGEATDAGTAVVRVLTLEEGTQQAIDLAAELAARTGELRVPGAVGLSSTLGVAKSLFARGQLKPATQLIRTAAQQVDTLVRTGRISAAEAAPLKSLLQRILDASAI